MTVFANGLEVACKAQSNQVIAAFPYVCMTPPQTPATPPGVPVPYPTFGMDGDTDKGTGTVKIGGATVTQKNLSYYTKCAGNEAGCAPMKNVVTHVNTGKDYAHAWSSDVKMDGEPISRFSDLSTNDHASPGGGGAPGPKIGSLENPDPACAHLKIAAYKDLECPEGYEKEHTVEVQFFTAEGVRDLTLECCKSYDHRDAPCICMKAEWIAGEGHKVIGKKFPRSSGKGTFTYTKKFIGKKRGTPHYYKSADARNWISANSNGTLGDFKDTCVKSTVAKGDLPPGDPAVAMKCLEVVNNEYLKKSMNKSDDQIKKKKMCHGACSGAKDQARLVQVAKKRLKRAAKDAGKDPRKVVVTAGDVTETGVACDYKP